MSRSNVDDVVFVTSFFARIAACGALGWTIYKLGRSMWDDVGYERGGLLNFQLGKH